MATFGNGTFAKAVAADPTKFLVLHVTGSLGNRMRAVAAGKFLAQDAERQLVVIW